MFLPSFYKSPAPQSKAVPYPTNASAPFRKTLPLVAAGGERPTLFFLGEEGPIFSLLQNVLESTAQIFAARTLHEMLALLEEHKPDLVLCDLQEQLPVMLDAFQTLPLIDIPFLVTATAEDRKDKCSLLEDRVTDLVMKPCEAAELNARIKGHLQNHLAKKTLQSELRKSNQPLEQMAQEIAERTKELNRMNKMKDEFMAVLSHELRNPINVIAGFAEVLRSGVDQPDLAREAADAIYRNAQMQIKLISDLFDVSRGIAGKLVLDTKPMQMCSVLQELLPMAREASSKKGITFRSSCDAAGSFIQGDSARISQVMWNLLTNAVKFTPQGGRIDVLLQRQGQWVEFSVKDNGHGIDPSFLPCMFERFNQQDVSITKKFGGLGLGLAIVRHIVDLHGGVVSASSDGLGHGATFTVRLPALAN